MARDHRRPPWFPWSAPAPGSRTASWSSAPRWPREGHVRCTRLRHGGLLGLTEHLMHPDRLTARCMTSAPRPPACHFAHHVSAAFSDTPNTVATSPQSRPVTARRGPHTPRAGGLEPPLSAATDWGTKSGFGENSGFASAGLARSVSGPAWSASNAVGAVVAGCLRILCLPGRRASFAVRVLSRSRQETRWAGRMQRSQGVAPAQAFLVRPVCLGGRKTLGQGRLPCSQTRRATSRSLVLVSWE